MEQQALYEFVSERTDRFALALSNERFWNALTVQEQGSVTAVSLYRCPSSGRSGSTLIGNNGQTHNLGGGGIHGPQGDYAIVAGQHGINWANWFRIDVPMDGDITAGNQNASPTARTRGPFRAAVWNTPSDPSSWQPRDQLVAWLADGTSNQILIGEKFLFPSALGRCEEVGAPGTNRALLGDCSLWAGGSDWATPAYARSFNGHMETSSADRFIANGELQQAGNGEAQIHWGSTHPGIANFLMGDGAVRSIPVTIPTGALAITSSPNDGTLNPNSILARLGNVSDGNPVTLP